MKADLLSNKASFQYETLFFLQLFTVYKYQLDRAGLV